jgi:hypothetical protein
MRPENTLAWRVWFVALKLYLYEETKEHCT